MIMTRIIFSALAAVASLAACAKAPTPEETTEKLRELTREATGAAENQSVTVSNLKLNGSRQVWAASVDGKLFSCDADNLFRLPACEPVILPGA